jgi:hypothetical protein
MYRFLLSLFPVFIFFNGRCQIYAYPQPDYITITKDTLPVMDSVVSEPKRKTDLEYYDLKGPVVSITEIEYEAVRRDGEIIPGAPSYYLHNYDYQATFNKDGFLISQSGPFEDESEEMYKMTYQYNGQGYLSERRSYHITGWRKRTTGISAWRYNDDNKLLESWHYYPDRSQTNRTLYEYNDTGQLSREKHYLYDHLDSLRIPGEGEDRSPVFVSHVVNGRLTDSVSYLFIENDSCVEKYSFYRDHTEVSRSDQEGNITALIGTQYAAYGDSTLWVYDSLGLRTEEFNYSYGKLTAHRKWIYTYDSTGRVTSYTSYVQYNRDKKLEPNYKCLYKYDRMGNVKEEVFLNAERFLFIYRFKPTTILVREIEYNWNWFYGSY